MIEIDGDELERIPYVTRGDDVSAKATAAFKVSGGQVRFDQIELYRDIYYTTNSRSAQYKIPDDAYFCLGDNTQNSADCRSWKVKEYRLKNGKSIQGNFMGPTHPDANPRIVGNQIGFENVYGQPYLFTRADVEDDSFRSYNKVPAEFMLGKSTRRFLAIASILTSLATEMGSMKSDLLRVDGLVKTYGKRTVVNGVSFEVNSGEIVGLLGPNGAGKTTSFRATIGMITPDAGEVYFKDEKITKLPMYQRARRGIGYLSQEKSIFRQMTVEENVLAVLEMRGMPRKQRLQKTAEAARRTWLAGSRQATFRRLIRRRAAPTRDHPDIGD